MIPIFISNSFRHSILNTLLLIYVLVEGSLASIFGHMAINGLSAILLLQVYKRPCQHQIRTNSTIWEIDLDCEFIFRCGEQVAIKGIASSGCLAEESRLRKPRGFNADTCYRDSKQIRSEQWSEWI